MKKKKCQYTLHAAMMIKKEVTLKLGAIQKMESYNLFHSVLFSNDVTKYLFCSFMNSPNNGIIFLIHFTLIHSVPLFIINPNIALFRSYLRACMDEYLEWFYCFSSIY